MHNSGLEFHHLGLAVKDKDSTYLFLTMLGYSIGKEVYDAHQKVNLTMCTHSSQPAIELISKGNEIGPLENILNKNKELIYHTCYRTKNIQESLKALNNICRVIPISQPSPAPLFDNKNVSFYYVRGFGIIEILEE